MEVLKTAKMLYPDILVIIMTGYASIETAIEAVKQGAYDYIRKPFRLEEMQISVDNACEKIRLRRENQLLQMGLEDAKKTKRIEDAGEKAPNRDPDPHVNIFAPEWAPPLTYVENLSGKEALQEIERLAALLKEGLIDKDEFKALKKGLLKWL
ncbi:response regulator [Dissulfurimicrobium hydrothermale]|nr:response regulator [Dissulfurimicrobium hydrothermale]